MDHKKTTIGDENVSEVKWIKIATDIFDDEKILLIESLPSSDSILVIWLKLLTLAGKQNNSGVLLLNDRIAYTEEMLSTIFRRDINTVRMALKAFEQYGMIEVLEGVITIPNWGKHQTLDKIEKYNSYKKEYMREYRSKQKKLAISENSCCNSNMGSNEESNCNSNVTCIEEEIEREEELDIDTKEINNSKLSLACGPKVPLQDIISKWNTNSNLSKITKLDPNTSRYKMLQARIKQYSIEQVMQAIDNISKSDFLQGFTSDFKITFDWFVKPNNFVKVLEGNYTNKGENTGGHNRITGEIELSPAEKIQRDYRGEQSDAPLGF